MIINYMLLECLFNSYLDNKIQIATDFSRMLLMLILILMHMEALLLYFVCKHKIEINLVNCIAIHVTVFYDLCVLRCISVRTY